MGKEPINEDGIFICPECMSKRITLILQATVLKMCDANTQKIINPHTGKNI